MTSTVNTTKSSSAKQTTSTTPAPPIFWPSWTTPALPSTVPAISLKYDYARVADSNGNASGTTFEWNQSNRPGSTLGFASGLDVFAGSVIGTGAQAVDLSLSRGATNITNLAGAYAVMEGQGSLNAATSLMATALQYGSFKLLGGPEALTIYQAPAASATAPSGVPAIIVDSSAEQATAGTDTIVINTATIASKNPATPDVFLHLGAETASVAVNGAGAAVIVGGAGALYVHDTNLGGTLLAFGKGPEIAWGGPGHNVYAVLAGSLVSTAFVYDFKGAAGAKVATGQADPFAQAGADTLEVSASLKAVTSVSSSGGGTLINFGFGHNLWLSGVAGFKAADISWLAGS